MGKAIGIDLGTSNIIVSYYDKKHNIRSLKSNGKSAIPTAIFFKSKNEFIIGDEALQRGLRSPQALATNFKYDMGSNRKQRFIAENGDTVAETPRTLAHFILTKIIDKATAKIMKDFPGEDIDKVVVTVPAKFNPTQKEDTKNAVEDVGIPDVKIALESTAAAIAYAKEHELSSKILVYDFGGGTFDVSIIQKSGNSFKELGTPNGDRHLGGNLLTKEIANYIFDELEREHGLDIPKDREDFDEDDYENFPEEIYLKNYYEIYKAANQLKEDLSDIDNATVSFPIVRPEGNGVKEMVAVDLDYTTFCNLVGHHIERTIDIVDKAIKDSGIEKDDIETVILTGGSSLVRLVQAKMEEYFDRGIPTVRTDTLISEGACILTEVMDSLQIDNNLPNDIGVKVYKGMGKFEIDKILFAGTPEAKAQGTKDFSIVKDNQSSINVGLYEIDSVNYPVAKNINDDGCLHMADIIIQLPDNLLVNNTIVRLNLTVSKEGTLILKISILDAKQKVIKEQTTTVTKINEGLFD